MQRKDSVEEIQYVHAYSFDFDGCLYNDDFYASEATHDDVLASNAELFTYLDTEISEEKVRTPNVKRVTFIGSSRQSERLNSLNMRQKVTLCKEMGLPGTGHSCFETIQTVAERLHSKLDTLLLADIYNNFTPGTAFKCAKNKSMEQPTIPAKIDTMISINKTAIAFAQIQKLAQDYPNAKNIPYDFFDDNKRVLNVLYDFFSKNPHYLPKNSTIRLIQYLKGERSVTLTFYPPIQGTGSPDKDYAEKIRDYRYLQNAFDYDASGYTGGPRPTDKKTIILENNKHQSDGLLSDTKNRTPLPNRLKRTRSITHDLDKEKGNSAAQQNSLFPPKCSPKPIGLDIVDSESHPEQDQSPPKSVFNVCNWKTRNYGYF